MSQQLQHDPVPLGGPCRRCGLKYSVKNAYIPCFVEGDTYGSWLARLPEEARELAAPSLAARTYPRFYDSLATVAREGGISEEQIDSLIEESIREANALLEGKCPKCSAPSTRYVNSQWQQGSSDVPGVWVMYRCSTQPPPGERRGDDVCDFMMDLKETVG